MVLQLDEPVPPMPQAFIGVRLPGYRDYRVFQVETLSVASDQVTLADPWPAGLPLPGSTEDDPAHDTLWCYDFKPTPGYRVRVVSMEPEADLKGARISCVPEGPEFWDYVINGNYVPAPNGSSLTATLPVASNLQITRARVKVGGGWEHELSATWDVTGNYDHAQVWAAPAGQPLVLIDSNVYGTRLAWRVPSDQTWSVEVRPFDGLGRMGTVASAVFTDPSVVVGAVVGLLATVETNGVVLRWNTPQNIDSIDYAATRIRMGLVGGSWETATPMFEGKADTCNLGWLQAGQLMFYAVHVNSAGDTSTPATTSLVILPPAQPIVTGDVWIDQVELRWTPSETTQPLRGYEVRVGPILGDAQILTVADAIGYVHTPPVAGTYLFWVTAIDRGGNRSAPGYVELTTLPHISEAIAQLQEGLDDVLQQLDDLPAYEDRWGVRVVSANGTKVGGIILGNDGQQADFIVLSDRFAWALPDGTGVKYPLVLGTIAGVPSFGFAGNMYVDGTIQARMIGVDQLRAEHIRSTELETRHFKTQTLQAMAGYFGVSGNMLPNSKLVTLQSWTLSPGASVNVALNEAGLGMEYRPAGENLISFHELPAAGVQPGAVTGYLWSDWVAVEPGKRYEVSAYSGAHRCAVEIYIEMQDGSGNWVGSSDPGLATARNDEQGAGGRSLGQFRRIFGFLVAPATAARGRFIMRKFGSKYGGGNDSWLMMTMPYLGVAGPYQTLPTDYSVSGVGTVITPAGISTPSLSAMSPNLGLVVNGRLVSADSQMTIDLDNKVIEMNWGGRRVRIDTNGFAFGPTGGTPKLFYNATTDQLTLNGTFTADAINAVSTVNVAGGTVTSMRVGQRDLGDYFVGSPLIYVDITMPAGSTGVVLFGTAEVRIAAASSSDPLVVSVVREWDGTVLGTGRFAAPNGTLDTLLVCVPVLAFDPAPVNGYGRYYLRVSGAGFPATWTSNVGRAVLTATGGKR
ncbi:MAG: hypothetical protein DI587_38850 [Variovorax paradoxus]|nr:MAG: hypothetical protein DI583_38850 [Variovorax paradoxus]PZP99098.1 MAG: hypothetical protein DI587_38850 [Variovorax paradoxus]